MPKSHTCTHTHTLAITELTQEPLPLEYNEETYMNANLYSIIGCNTSETNKDLKTYQPRTNVYLHTYIPTSLEGVCLGSVSGNFRSVFPSPGGQTIAISVFR